MMARVLGINHIGLAPKDSAKARWFFEKALGLTVLGEQLVKDQSTVTLMIRSTTIDRTTLEPRLEVLTPEGGTAGPIAKFLEKKGSGLHHLALNVEGLEGMIAHLLSLGVKMIDEKPRPGAHHTQIAFVHPEATGGLLIELVEESTKRGDSDDTVPR